MPTPEFTKEIRNWIDKDFKSLNKILQNKKFKKEFGYFVENVDRVKTAPKWFSKDHKNIELIRLKHWVTNKALNDKDILEKGFYDKLLESFKTMAALNRWLEDKFDNIK